VTAVEAVVSHGLVGAAENHAMADLAAREAGADHIRTSTPRRRSRPARRTPAGPGGPGTHGREGDDSVLRDALIAATGAFAVRPGQIHTYPVL
jgi:hypothetical protein